MVDARLPGRRRELVAKSNASFSWDGDAEWADENEGEAGLELVEAVDAPGGAAGEGEARANGLGEGWEGWWCEVDEPGVEGGYSGDVGRECAVGRIEASLGSVRVAGTARCSGWTRRRRRRRRNSISRSRRARTRASLENSSRLFPLARSHKYCIDGEARLKVQSTTQRDRETTSPAGAHREGGHRNQGEQLVEEERGYRKGAWRGLLLGRVEGRGQRRGWYREARGCGEWCDERGRGDAEGGCEARWCRRDGDARLTSGDRTRRGRAHRWPERMSDMNSARVLSLRRNAPSIEEVMVDAPGFCTPRIVMHWCLRARGGERESARALPQ